MNGETRRDYLRAWKAANPERVEEYNRRRRAKYAAKSVPLERRCLVCRETFSPSRRDAKTCSRICRSRLSQIGRTERDRARRAGEA